MMAKKKNKAAAPLFDPARFRAAEEASMAGFPVAQSTPVVDERTKLQEGGFLPEPKLTGAERAAITIQNRKNRFQEELDARAASKPTEDPGPGNIWSYNVSEGRWKKVFVGGGLGGSGSYGSGLGEGEDEGSTGTTYTAPDGKIFKSLAEYNAYINKIASDEKQRAGQSAWNLLKGYLDNYGLGMLAGDVEKYIKEGVSYDELLLKLRTESKAYKKRFAANESRIQKGLRALSEAEYIGLEDSYQDIMRRYGMPETYYRQEKDPVTGVTLQPGFEKLIAGDVSAVELEDRVQTAYDRVINANPQITQTLREFYPEISNGDILAYALDPQNAINNIKRKVTATEIGAAAAGENLATSRTRAEELRALGVTGQQYRQAAPTIKEAATVGTRLSSIYGDEKYGQAEAEAELLDIAGAGEASRRRKKLTGLETAQFSKASGLARGALGGTPRGAI